MDYYLTPERLEELKNELEDLKTRGRADVAERLKRAKELGDLSENSEYFEAREEQARIETRISELEDMVKNAKLIQKSEKKNGVSVGSKVTASKNGGEVTFTIVGSNEARPEDGKISNESPLGKAFLGKKAGDSVEVSTPSGKIAYKIVRIE